jgi:hypothetical protein
VTRAARFGTRGDVFRLEKYLVRSDGSLVALGLAMAKRADRSRLAVAVSAFAVIACGGRTDVGIGPGDSRDGAEGGGSSACPADCPDPASIELGAACTFPSSMTSCPSTLPNTECGGTLSCFCYAGVWNCPPGVLCAGCPPPAAIFAGDPCPADAERCPGNPQACGGATFYDAFQCMGGVWVDEAPTICEIDAGPESDAEGD